MSMTSGQCDELREKAKLLRGHVDGLSAPYVMPSTKELMALTMLDSAGRMEQAADTILELREMAQRANTENAKLREERDHWRVEQVHAYGNWEDTYKRASELEAENAKLVDVLHEVEAEAVHAYRCLQQDCETATKSSEHFFKKWWHAECECDQLKAENAKLRELVRRYSEYTDQDRCEGCACKSRCNDGDVGECWQLTEIRELARELEVGVDE